MKNIIYVLPLLLCNIAYSGEPDEALHEKCIYPTILVYSCDPDSCGTHGSGVIVRSEKIDDNRYVNVMLTCHHVICDIKDVRVAIIKYKNWSEIDTTSAKEYRLRIYASDPTIDIAIGFFITAQKMHAADVGMDEKLYLGNELVGVGCAGKNFPRLNYGRLTSLHGLFHTSSILTVPGDSGGPIYHNYKLVGLKTAIRNIVFHDEIMPVFQLAQHIPTMQLKQWDVYNNVSFVYDTKETLPQLPIIRAKICYLKKSAVDPVLEVCP